MPNLDRFKPSIPAIYSHILVREGVARGLDQVAIVQGLELPGSFFGSVLSRVSLDQFERLTRRLIALAKGHPTAGRELDAFGYEFGLRMGISTAGVMGAAALTRADLRSAIEFLVRFAPLATGLTDFRFFVDDDSAVVEVTVSPVPDDLHRYLYDWTLVGLWRMAIPLLGDAWREVELWFAYPEPEYYARYREKLPRCRFDMGVNQICLPARLLERPLASGDPVSAEMLEQQCRMELELLGSQSNIVEQVRSFLGGERGYPDVEALCSQIFMSPRTLKRKLQQQGTSFQQLLEDARREEAMALLGTSSLTIERIAERLGYAETGSFSHAFRKWTGVAPAIWRRRRGGT